MTTNPPVNAGATVYRAVAEHDDGWWIVHIADVEGQGVHTQGRTVQQAEYMARDAVAAVLDVPIESVDITMQVTLPNNAETVIGQLQAARLAKAEAAEREQETLRCSARGLIDIGLSAVDAGTLLGVTRSRVYQLVGDEKPRRSKKRSGRA